MWDYYSEKTLQSMVLQYEFDFEKVSDFFRKHNQHDFFSPEECRRHYSKIYGGCTQKSPLSDFFQENIQPNIINNKNFQEYKEKFEKEESEQKLFYEKTKLKKSNKEESMLYSPDYMERKKKEEKRFFEEQWNNKKTELDKKEEFVYYFLERNENKLEIKKAELFSEEARVLKKKLFSSVKEFSPSLDQCFENLKIPKKKYHSKLSLYYDVISENDNQIDLEN
jgi:hypothetical protein